MTSIVNKLNDATIGHSASFLDASSLASLSTTCKTVHKICSASYIKDWAVYMSEEEELAAAAQVLRAAATINPISSSSYCVGMKFQVVSTLPSGNSDAEYEVWAKVAKVKRDAAFNHVKKALQIESNEELIRLDEGIEISKESDRFFYLSLYVDTRAGARPANLSALADRLSERAERAKTTATTFQQRALERTKANIVKAAKSEDSAIFSVD